MESTAKDLRFNTKELLETVRRGEEVVITYRGKPCAKLVPLNKNKNSMEHENELFGVWKNNKEVEDVSEYVDNLRKGRF